jgi:hypothetical protein
MPTLSTIRTKRFFRPLRDGQRLGVVISSSMGRHWREDVKISLKGEGQSCFKKPGKLTLKTALGTVLQAMQIARQFKSIHAARGLGVELQTHP